jgi:L-lactate dehydrogenase complex protein LldG
VTARDAILGRIARACGGAGAPEAVVEQIRHHPRGPVPAQREDLVHRFCHQATRLASDVACVATLREVPPQVAAYLRERGLPLQAVCWPALADLEWGAAAIEIEARPAGGDDPVGITGAFTAIAETGTLMLLSGPRTPATVSLLPETHVAVVERAQVVSTMEDAWERLRAEHGSLPRAVTFVSGPSRTADIEQTVTFGAHGPYRVLIVVVGGLDVSPRED